MRGAVLANPETGWDRHAHVRHVERAEVERCLGDAVPGFEVLPGGLANTNVRVGDRVVRIYRGAEDGTAHEARLLARPWRSFRVPRVLARGERFLVLEHVPHTPLTDADGAACGAALAEIHRTPFAGLAEPFPDLVGALLDYARPLLPPEAASVLVDDELRAAAGPTVLVHSDFKVSNLHWANDGRLLVLDWETAYAGSALSDIGQLLRWEPPAHFVHAFATAYSANGGVLIPDWQRWSAVFDLFNLAGLLANQKRPIPDVDARIRKTLGASRLEAE